MPDYRVTFGNQYSYLPHPTLAVAHPDGWVTIAAPSEEIARELTVELLGTAWSFLYPPERWSPVAEDGHVYFPRGELARFEAADD